MCILLCISCNTSRLCGVADSLVLSHTFVSGPRMLPIFRVFVFRMYFECILDVFYVYSIVFRCIPGI